MDKESLARGVYESDVRGKRKGKPRIRWIDTVRVPRYSETEGVYMIQVSDNICSRFDLLLIEAHVWPDEVAEVVVISL